MNQYGLQVKQFWAEHRPLEYRTLQAKGNGVVDATFTRWGEQIANDVHKAMMQYLLFDRIPEDADFMTRYRLTEAARGIAEELVLEPWLVPEEPYQLEPQPLSRRRYDPTAVATV